MEGVKLAEVPPRAYCEWRVFGIAEQALVLYGAVTASADATDIQVAKCAEVAEGAAAERARQGKFPKSGCVVM